MAKQNNPSTPVDEQYLMDVIAGVFSTKKEMPETVQPEVKQKVVTVIESEEKSVKSGRRKRTNTADYETTFLQRNELKARQSVYISKEIHEKVSRIVKVLGGRDLSVGGYIDNVLSQHFETYMDEINALYDIRYEKLF